MSNRKRSGKGAMICRK